MSLSSAKPRSNVRELLDQRGGKRMKIDTRWLRAKAFPVRSSVAFVVSFGRHEGRRLNISLHRVPKPITKEEDTDA